MAEKKITVKYFAQLAQQRRLSQEVLNGLEETTLDWYLRLQREHGFLLTPEEVKPALNGQYVSWQTVVGEGDVLVFIPPVAGG